MGQTLSRSRDRHPETGPPPGGLQARPRDRDLPNLVSEPRPSPGDRDPLNRVTEPRPGGRDLNRVTEARPGGRDPPNRVTEPQPGERDPSNQVVPRQGGRDNEVTEPHPGGIDLSNLAACEAFRKHSADLIRAIQDPEVLAWELYSDQVISDSVVDDVSVAALSPVQKKTRLLAAVRDQITVDPAKIVKFIQALRKQPIMEEVARKLEETYRKLETCSYTVMQVVRT